MLNKSWGLLANTSFSNPKNLRSVASTAWKTSGMLTRTTIRKIMNPIDERIPNMILNFKGDTYNTADKPSGRQAYFPPFTGKNIKKLRRERERKSVLTFVKNSDYGIIIIYIFIYRQ